MKTPSLLPVATLFAFATFASARPLVVQENARIVNPDPANYPEFPGDVGVDGDDAMISMRIYHSNYPDAEDEADHAVWLFRRVNGTWTPIRRILQDHDYYYIRSNGISMQDGVAALAMNPFYIFERRDGDWVQASIDYAGTYIGPGDDVEVDGGRVFYGGSDGTWAGTLFLRDAPGSWRASQRLYGDARGGDDEYEGGPVDLSGERAIVFSPYTENSEFPVNSPSLTAYRQFPGGAFYSQSSIQNDPDRWPLGYEAAVRGDEIFIAGTDRTGTHVFRPGPSDSWLKATDTQLQPLDSHMGAGQTWLIRKNELFVFQLNYSPDRDANVINVFAKNAANDYEHVATLAASGNDSLGSFGVSGRRVIANCEGGEACVFDLPASLAQPPVVQDTFTGASPTGWTTSAGSQFTVAQSGLSRVLRQSETASPATHTAILTASNWTNQSVQADVRATAFAGTDRWLGLATRYSDAANHYYVTLRSSGSVSLKRMRNGAFATLASAQVAVTPNRTYRLRLESIGTRHRVFVDGIPLLDVDDATLASGRAALLTYRTAAEFDNVVASPTPAATLFRADSFFQGGPTAWTHTGPGLWTGNDDGVNSWFGQYSVAGDARAIVGVPTDDQAIDVRARPTTFAGTGTGDRWFGAMARYVDDSNYYYLSVRSSNTVSLRKLVNGSITVLASTTLPVSLGTWYSLRIEAVGSRIRGWVNGVLTLEAEDSSHASGATGLVTYRAAADFDDYRAIQP
jgi:hypothetical protein